MLHLVGEHVYPGQYDALSPSSGTWKTEMMSMLQHWLTELGLVIRSVVLGSTPAADKPHDITQISRSAVMY